MSAVKKFHATINTWSGVNCFFVVWEYARWD